MSDVFISYKSNDPNLGNYDGNVADELCELLESVGITCWIAPRDIDLGTKGYARSIMEGIENCKIFLLVFSRYANESEYVASEIDAAFAAEKDIIPFCLDKTQPNRELRFYLGRKQWIYVEGDYHERFHEIVDALLQKLGKKSTVAQEHFDNRSEVLGPFSDENLIKSFSVNGVSFNMVRVDGGEFIMGATPEQGTEVEDNEKSPHQVNLSSYYIGETQVTQALWQTVMGTNPSKNRNNLRCPVDNVSWDDCQKFIVKLNELTGMSFHLPTEAEWEYAARGGRKSKGYKYAGGNDLKLVAWYAGNSRFDDESQDPTVSNKMCLYDLLNKVTSKRFQMPGEENWEHITNKRSDKDALDDKSKSRNGEISTIGTHIVAARLPNELGIYDMSGNVYEWCQGICGSYMLDNQDKPNDLATECSHVLRGGSCYSDALCCRVSYRCFDSHGTGLTGVGLRLAL